MSRHNRGFAVKSRLASHADVQHMDHLLDAVAISQDLPTNTLNDPIFHGASLQDRIDWLISVDCSNYAKGLFAWVRDATDSEMRLKRINMIVNLVDAVKQVVSIFMNHYTLTESNIIYFLWGESLDQTDTNISDLQEIIRIASVVTGISKDSPRKRLVLESYINRRVSRQKVRAKLLESRRFLMKRISQEYGKTWGPIDHPFDLYKWQENFYHVKIELPANHWDWLDQVEA